VGVCGSDLHYFLSDSVGGERVAYPFIPGHECAGIVEEVGKAVTRVKPGDAVVIEPAVLVRRPATSAGRGGRTPAASSSSSATTASSPAEWPNSPWPRSELRAPAAKMSVVQGALAEPLSIAIYAAGLAGSCAARPRPCSGRGRSGYASSWP